MFSAFCREGNYVPIAQRAATRLCYPYIVLLRKLLIATLASQYGILIQRSALRSCNFLAPVAVTVFRMKHQSSNANCRAFAPRVVRRCDQSMIKRHDLYLALPTAPMSLYIARFREGNSVIGMYHLLQRRRHSCDVWSS